MKFTEEINEMLGILKRNDTLLNQLESNITISEAEKSSETTRDWAIVMWRVNRERPITTLDKCLEMIKSTQLSKDSCSHQNSINNYEVALRVLNMLMERILLVGDDELLKIKNN